jgi:DNA processing protein
MEEIVYWAHLAAIEGVGDAIFDQLLKRFGSIKRAMEAERDEVLEIPGFDERTAETVCQANQTVSATEARIKELSRKGVNIITKMDAAFPQRLREAADPPPIVYQIGKVQPKDHPAVAIIGSRECSEVSAKRAREYGAYLAQNGISVVSGYAFGVDINGHVGAIEGGGRTIIVPGCGISVFNLDPLKSVGITAFEELAKSAVVITEEPPDRDWSARSSLARNRLVAAYASALLVIEARLHSSTLDTVEKGRKLGRPVFAQSFGTISERVMGNEKLRNEGAVMIGGAQDLDKIIETLKGKKDKGTKGPKLDDLRR